MKSILNENCEEKFIAIYRFDKVKKTPCVLSSVIGEDVLPLPTYKRGENNGKRYVIFDDNLSRDLQEKTKYPKVLNLEVEQVGTVTCKKGSHKRLTGLKNPLPIKYPKRFVGDTNKIGRDDALLVELTGNAGAETLTIYVFEHAKVEQDNLFNRWCENKLNLTLERIPAQKENAESHF